MTMFKNSKSSKFSAFDIANGIFMTLIIITTLYPFLFIISSSISDPVAILRNEVVLWPVRFSIDNYKVVFSNNNVLLAYWNTIRYTVVGTAISIVLTLCMAYALSRKRFTGRVFIMKIVTFTLLFNGGIIPTYLIIRGMGMIDTIWAIVLSGAVSAWNLIVTRTFFDGMPDSLEESGIIEGCNDIQVFYYIFLPLSLPITATMILFYAVGQWNSFFVPLLYLNDKKKFPLMIFLRNLLIQGDVTQYEGMGSEVSVVQQGIKYAIIVVTTLPIVLVYPFLQKYFVKGVMIGSIKG